MRKKNKEINKDNNVDENAIISPLIKEKIDTIFETKDIYDTVKIRNQQVMLKKSLLITFVLITVFYLSMILLYFYSDYQFLQVYIPDHEHVYSGEGAYYEGDCSHYGYTEYYCEKEYCESKITVYDTDLGNHRYREAPYIWNDEEGIHYRYICSICGQENILSEKIINASYWHNDLNKAFLIIEYKNKEDENNVDR